jgi:hypothetical protein
MTGILAMISSRMLKKGAGWLGQSQCSRNARSQKTLVGRAQLGSSQPPLNRVMVRCGLACGKARLGAPGWAGEKSGLFEHPAWP